MDCCISYSVREVLKNVQASCDDVMSASAQIIVLHAYMCMHIIVFYTLVAFDIVRRFMVYNNVLYTVHEHMFLTVCNTEMA